MQTKRVFAAFLGAAAFVVGGASGFAQDGPIHDATPVTDGAPPPAVKHGWPRTFDEGGVQLTMYQPQLERWDNARIVSRAAISVETPGSTQPVYGVLWTQARTEIDKEQRLVTLEEFEFTRASFPSAPERTDEWLALLRRHVPTHAKTVELDRLEASLAVTKAETSAQQGQLRNDPPRIFFSSRPSILVLVDGAPVLQPVAGGLQRVINTRALVLENGDGSHFYLGVADRWLEAPGLDGPWTLAGSAPDGAEQARSAAVAANQVDLYAEDAEAVNLLAGGDVPTVFASTEPAELIESTGEPAFTPVPGTRLLWAKNSDADVFIDSTSGQNYVLCSARWFRAPSRRGPWTFVRGTELPPDFARIPPTAQAAEVLSSIPGTPQAQEAIIANQIPQTATINRADAHCEVTYDGEPRYEAIEGTNLNYVVNGATPVVRMGDAFYACENGVWFLGSSPGGPWVACDSVPAEIYSIPPSCPIHYVTYVRVYKSDANCIYTGYTPGYFGTCVSRDNCVVWGSGYRHQPWVGTRWIGRPATYGFGIGARWSSDSGWSIGIGVGARPPSRPWWGPLSTPHPAFYPERHEGVSVHMNFNNANIYNRRPGVVVREQVVVHDEGRGRVVAQPARPNNVYSTADGNVYRRTNQGWEQHGGNSFHAPANPNAEVERQRAERLDAEQHARLVGSQRVETLRSPPPARVEPQHSQPREQPRAQPVAPQRNPVRESPRSAPSHPAPIAPGLRGGTSRR
jgi:hypothetical protein